jgi:hypothetical protein
MPRAQATPERLPVHDVVHGRIEAAADAAGSPAALLLIGAVDAEGETLLEGEVVLRYGIRYLGKPHLSIVPGLLVLDYGTMLNGEEAWAFLLRRSNLYPRAEVFGYRHDGRDEMMLVKNLDIALPAEVLAYPDLAATAPAARLRALIAPDAERHTLPARLLEALPRYADVPAWRAHTATE